METANQIKASKTEEIPTLPGEIIEEILSRLPVKSLLRFRCVSKSWRSLIASNCFINAHLENSRKNPTFVHHGIILSPYSPHLRIKYCSLHSLVNEPVTYSISFEDPIRTLEHSVCVVGCCNGLICILIGRKSFLLWNPSTRVSKKLPFVDDKLKHGYITKYGFGFDESSGDYKVYGILSVFWSTGRYEAAGNVYSLKNNSWNRIEDKDGDTFGEAGKFVSGKLHWGRKFGSNYEWDIVSFDLKSEVYGTVEKPSNLDVGYHPSLGELGGCLCMLCDYWQFCLDIWVLKQYGVKESWNKVVTIPYCDPWEGRFSFVYCMAENGEILLSYASKFIMYSLKDKQFRYPQMVNHDRFREADVYIESLVSPSPGG